jgi:hypothetical protein
MVMRRCLRRSNTLLLLSSMFLPKRLMATSLPSKLCQLMAREGIKLQLMRRDYNNLTNSPTNKDINNPIKLNLHMIPTKTKLSLRRRVMLTTDKSILSKLKL